jgi:septal ring factor EnvC (AmiA/AmiB activator)
MTALAKYDAACAALAAAVSADEVMRVHVTAAGIEAVARMAGDFENELKSTKLRTRAAARLGDMITEGEASGVIAKHGGKRKQDDQDDARDLDPKPATLRRLRRRRRRRLRRRILAASLPERRRSGEEALLAIGVSQHERLGVIRRIRRTPSLALEPLDWLPASGTSTITADEVAILADVFGEDGEMPARRM